MIVSLDEMKQYLRVDFEDDDDLIEEMIRGAEALCKDIAREEDASKFSELTNARLAVMYAVAYQYEHREEANFRDLTLTIRALLFGNRKAAF